MFTVMPLIPKSVEDYVELIPEADIEMLRQLARPLEACRVLHLSMTTHGTAVAETLSSAVALAGGLGLRWEWEVVTISDEFRRAAMAIYEALSGIGPSWDVALTATWQRYSALAALMFDQDYDFVIVHDPQVMMLLGALIGQRGIRPPGKWVWHCHLDLSRAQREACELLSPYIPLYGSLVESGAGFMDTACSLGGRAVILPAIDPLAPKNAPMAPETVSMVLARHGIDPERPLVLQVAPLDRWSDPIGLVAAYQLAKEVVPGLQLALVSTTPSEYGEAVDYHRQLSEVAAADKDAHIPFGRKGIGSLEINAFQRAATVVVQRSIRGGYSLPIAEAMWKGQPVVADLSGRMSVQVVDGVNGYLVRSDEECAQRIVDLVRQPEVARRFGQAGREHVQRHFLVTRWLADYLALLGQLL